MAVATISWLIKDHAVKYQHPYKVFAGGKIVLVLTKEITSLQSLENKKIAFFISIDYFKFV